MSRRLPINTEKILEWLAGIAVTIFILSLLWSVFYGILYRDLINPIWQPETVTIVGVTHDDKVILLFEDNNVKEFDSGKLMSHYLRGDTQVVVEVNRRYLNDAIVDEVR